MNPATDNNSKLIKIGKITPDDQQLLTKQKQKAIKYFTVAIVIMAILFWTVFGAIVAIALYFARKKECAKLELIKSGDVELYKIHGILTSKSGGRNITLYYVDGYGLPLFNGRNHGVGKYKGQPLTIELYPAIFVVRAHYDSDGNGFNYLSKTAIGLGLEGRTS